MILLMIFVAAEDTAIIVESEVERRSFTSFVPMSEQPHVTIYTDGACSGNPGPGGYGAVLLFGDRRLELSQGFKNTTNNRMELLAVIAALERLTRSCGVTLYSDSQYVVDAVTKRWVYSWKRNNWRRADKKPAQNVDLWQRLLPLLEKHSVEFKWVRGHNNNLENERCDQLAVAATQGGDLIIDDGFQGGAVVNRLS
jgi:ribonuclease HI